MRSKKRVRPLLPEKDPGRFNQSLMELGALCCTPKSPSCQACPLSAVCLAPERRGLEGLLPLRRKRPAIPHRPVVAAVIRDSRGRILVVQRPASGLLGSLWKFPGGIIHPGESPQEGLKRLVLAELSITIGIDNRLAAVDHAYTHFRITLTAFACRLLQGAPEGPPWRWADGAKLEALPLSTADRKIARLVSDAK